MTGAAPGRVCLVLFAHGSRDPVWCASVERTAAGLAARLDDRRMLVAVAYMSAAEPTLAELARRLRADNVDVLRVLPLFWASGGHVDRDIPEQIAAVRAEHGDALTVELLPPVGEHPLFADLLERIARE